MLCCPTQMILRRLLTALVLLALIAGHPMAAPAGTECQTVAAAADSGCCGTGDMASCVLACSVPAAAVGRASARVAPLDAGAPLDGPASTTRSFSRPPDTAPPKLFSA